MNHLEMAEELDGMERDVTSWEADFLEKILEILRFGLQLSPKQADTLEKMHERYLGSDGPNPFSEIDL